MNERHEEVRCIECGDFYNREFMNGSLCVSCKGDADGEKNNLN